MNEWLPMKWISVTDRLPTKPVPVLVTVTWDVGPNTVKVAWCDGTWHSGYECDGNIGGTVIAWMPMPIAYKEGE